MEGVQSYEQKSTIEAESRGNRVIIANRREPDIYWTESRDAPPQSAQSLRPAQSCFSSSLFHSCCTSQEPAESEMSFGRAKWKRRLTNDHVMKTLSYSSQTLGQQSTFDFGPFPSNVWTTSKYTLLNFLFKNLYEQFRRLANFYFLITAIVQVLIPYSPIGPSTSLIPLAFVVGTTAIKQAYEDYLRHKLDNDVNNRHCLVLRDKKRLEKVRSKDIRVGDIVHVKNNEEIPCDMILLASSGNGDRCYITTANLDGETSLKGRTCFQIHQQVGDIDKINESMLVIECEKPSATLYEFNGYLRAPKDRAAYENLMKDVKHLDEFRGCTGQSSSLGSSTIIKRLNMISTIFQRMKTASSNTRLRKQLSAGQLKYIGANNLIEINTLQNIEIPLDISNLLLRASRLRNTSFIYGLAVYTGPDTRLAHNSQVKPNKFSSLESRVNMFLAIAFVLLLLLTLVSALKHKRGDGTDSSIESVQANTFLQIFLAYFVLYNYLVPISLYVTLEFVKFLGTISVLEDEKLQGTVAKLSTSDTSQTSVSDDSQNQNPSAAQAKREAAAKQLVGPQCNSSDLNEDLGQVEVLFSDKTGTLTENKMHFMACSIHGHLYRALNGGIFEQPEGFCFLPTLNVAHKLSRINTNRYAALAVDLAAHSSPRSLTSSGGGLKSVSRSSRSSSERMAKLPLHQRPFDHRSVPPLHHLKHLETLDQHVRVTEFLLCLCLCSTITLNEQLPLEQCLPKADSDHYDYQSASPDEESLISAAAQFGVLVCKSSERECFIAIKRHVSMNKRVELQANQNKQFRPLVETANSNEKYLVRHFERLVTFEFNSIRKKMSVLYRDCDNDCVVMFTKGSESVLDCIAIPDGGEMEEEPVESEDQVKRNVRVINKTLGHFEAFSKSGLRTMLVAKRSIAQSEFEGLNSELLEARLLPMQEQREQRIAQLYARVESDMSLIGATAVEDSLQEGVPEMIANLKEAGIKVWLLTGDKVETAISVAYLCKLLDRNMNLLHLVRQQDSQACKDKLASFVAAIKAALLYGEEDEVNSFGQPTQPPRESVSKRPHSLQKQQLSLNQSRKHLGLEKAMIRPSTVLRSSRMSVINEMDMPRFALIADGRSLHYAMKYARTELEFVCTRCICVLGCRLSPLQKAEIVAMIKSSAGEPITAAIGDGANDVSMIQEAHVGIGISGKEGRQAVNSSDFAINRFRMIGRLFFVHGHLFYHRTANTVHYFFYKNLLFIMPQFIYSYYNFSSATSLYHPIVLISFNMLFTSVPILVYGLCEVNIPKPLLENYPRLYRINNRNGKMSYLTFVCWLLMGGLQAAIAFFTIVLIWDTPKPIIEASRLTSPIDFSTILFTSMIFCVTLKLYFLSKETTRGFDCASAVSCLLVPVILYVASLFDLSKLFHDNSLYRQYEGLLRSLTYWLAIMVTTASMVVPDMVFYICEQITYYRTLNSVIN